MIINRYESDLLCSNMYVVSENGHAIVIDPYRNIIPAAGLTIDRIILTHEHYDHISGVQLWKEHTKAPVLCSRACADNIDNPKKNLAGYFDEFCGLQTWVELNELPDADRNYSCSADDAFEESMSFDWQGHDWNLFEMPGHSQGSIGILLDEKYFFSGDSLIENHEIATRLPGGSRKKWNEVGAPRLSSIPVGITVYPGHFQSFIYHKIPAG